MKRKLFAALMALAAFAAFAVIPSLASARPVLTHPTGTVIPINTKIRAHNVGETVMTTPFGNVTCSTATMTGTLKKNNTAEGVEGEVTSATFAGTGAEVGGEKECSSWTGGVTVTPNPATNGLPWCVKATGTTDVGSISGGPCGASRPIRFALDFTSIGTCTYQRTEAATGTLTTHPEDAVIHLSNQVWSKFEGGALCPSEGKLDMSFTLETDATVNTEPIYFSS
jgi:hypothetical protein